MKKIPIDKLRFIGYVVEIMMPGESGWILFEFTTDNKKALVLERGLLNNPLVANVHIREAFIVI